MTLRMVPSLVKIVQTSDDFPNNCVNSMPSRVERGHGLFNLPTCFPLSVPSINLQNMSAFVPVFPKTAAIKEIT